VSVSDLPDKAAGDPRDRREAHPRPITASFLRFFSVSAPSPRIPRRFRPQIEEYCAAHQTEAAPRKLERYQHCGQEEPKCNQRTGLCKATGAVGNVINYRQSQDLMFELRYISIQPAVLWWMHPTEGWSRPVPGISLTEPWVAWLSFDKFSRPSVNQVETGVPDQSAGLIFASRYPTRGAGGCRKSKFP
jgi:hypothetical protein